MRIKKKLTIIAAIAAVILASWATGCHSSSPKNISPIPGRASAGEGDHGESAFATAANHIPGTSNIPAIERLFGGTRGEALKTQPSSLFADTIGDELWVIYRPERTASATEDDQYPGTGSLMTKVREREVPLPLKHTDVKASVAAYIASVNVTQQFENPFDEKIEAVYVFPLPENGAVNEFLMTIGQRRIRGIVRERKEAEKIYAQAKQQGYVASLMTQERPNIFTQSVANIEPGKSIDITIRYYNTLSWRDSWYEFVFPMVVGPRFNPPGHTKGIGAVDESGYSISGQPTDVHYLHPTERSGHDISLLLDLEPGVNIEEFECKTHSVLLSDRLDQDSNEKWQPLHSWRGENSDHLSVKLDRKDSIPNKDFVFRYRVAGDKVKSSLITHEDERGGFFTLMVYPPAALESLDRAPLEMVFVLDCSGSMSGEPLKQAKSAIEWALKHMDERDTFQLINFSDRAKQLGRWPIPATRENVRRGLDYLDSLRSEGGTMMIEGIKSALNFPHDPDRLRFVCFLTDGYIGNENEILQEIHQRLGDSRIFSFGVGSSVNRFLLDSMAKVGRGAVAYLGLKDNGGQVMKTFFETISHPALTDIKIKWGDFDVNDIYPRRLPDVFVGKPLIVTGRYESQPGLASEPIQIFGRTGKGKMQIPIPAFRNLAPDSTEALPSIWARIKIADLLESSQYEPSLRTTREVRQTALDFQLLSPYTAFIALDASRRTKGQSGTTVPVAVPVPEGVKYETTVDE